MTFPAIDNLPPIHPGEILRDDLEALGLSARRFAEHIGVPPNAVTEILRGERRVTAPMALRFAKAFGTDPKDTGPTSRASMRLKKRKLKLATLSLRSTRCHTMAKRHDQFIPFCQSEVS